MGTVHKKCSGIKGSMFKVMKSLFAELHEFSNQYRSHSVDIGVTANLQLVDKFCYLDDILNVD